MADLESFHFICWLRGNIFAFLASAACRNNAECLNQSIQTNTAVFSVVMETCLHSAAPKPQPEAVLSPVLWVPNNLCTQMFWYHGESSLTVTKLTAIQALYKTTKFNIYSRCIDFFGLLLLVILVVDICNTDIKPLSQNHWFQTRFIIRNVSLFGIVLSTYRR